MSESESDASSNASAESEEQQVEDLSNEQVVTKYKLAAEIVNNALKAVVAAAKAGVTVVELCKIGDSLLQKGTDALYTKAKGERKVEKGIAFPTCVSLNNVVGHYSPLSTDTPVVALKDGDLVKVDLGAHVDGYIAMGAHSFVVGVATAEGRQADVLAAAHYAAEAIHRLLRPGKTGYEIQNTIQKIASVFNVRGVEGTLSHSMKRFVIDGNNVITNSTANIENKVDDFTIGENEVYGIDLLFSTGEGKPVESEQRTTVFKRRVDVQYRLKMKASMKTFSEFNKRFPATPFSLRLLEDEKTAKLGIIECLKHDLVAPYPVLIEKEGETVVQLKFTALVLPSATHRITGLPTVAYKPNATIEDKDLLALLATSAGKKQRKKKPAKKAAPAAATQ
eukprot:TRINITY_DN4446_c0_g1_i1.p1 TRINITY_DN4446_c0_g1~~TRINITY_DN4446_c0_g1_i1.p1  ORF type:complete len:393 (-),score=132.83 TRINITY_DN4446_c0_g1_i1:52-1230(-)